MRGVEYVGAAKFSLAALSTQEPFQWRGKEEAKTALAGPPLV